MMSVSTIREAINNRPFRPFTIHVSDQRAYTIPHPEFVAIGPNGRTLVVFHDDGGASFLDMLLVSGIDVPARSESPGGEN